MKDLKTLGILIIFLVAMSATSLLAQGRQTRTSSAKAAYGYPADHKVKKKKKKAKKSKTPKKKGKQPLYRKKSPWVN
jgi:hypothetical protein